MADANTVRTDRRPLEAALIPFGVLFIAAAVAGAAVKGAGFELPALSSAGRQLLAGLVGIVLIAAGTASRWWPPLSQRLQAQTAPGQPSPEAGLVPDPTPHFVGREVELEDLHQRLHAFHRVALSGLGGIGKTQLAAQYAGRNRDAYLRIFWLRAEDATTLTSDFASLAWVLGLPERQRRDHEAVTQAVINWLRLHVGWLIVVDNLEEGVTRTLERLLPPGLPGYVLATSRRPLWDVRLTLEPLPNDVAAGFLLSRTGQKDGSAAGTLADKLGCLPLALAQASAYMEQTGEHLARYAQLLEESPGQLLAQGRIRDYPLSVAGTWAISFDRVARTSAAAAELLRFCAFLGPDAIPLELLENGAPEFSQRPQLQAAVGNRLKLNRAVSALLDYSLASRQEETLSVHRLVQVVIRESMPADRRRQWAATAVRVIARAFPVESRAVASWTTCQRLLPHALAALGQAAEQQCDDLSTSQLLDGVAGYLHTRTEFAAARPLLERALEIRERVLGPEHPDTAISLAKLAWVLRDQGETSAGPLFRRAVEILERVLGPDHPQTAASLNDLAGLLRDQGELAAAGPLFERALEISERVLGPDHPQTAISLNNLAGLLRDLGELSAARPLFERALEISERVLGPDHPRTAQSVNNLALVLWDQGDLASARSLFERALETLERLLGPDHPQTGGSLNNLALVLRDQGDLAAGSSFNDRARKIWERVLGPNHPGTANSLNNLGLFLKDQGEVAAARQLHERALEIRERVSGPDHPDTAQSLNNLALLLPDPSELDTARTLLERALEIRERVLGPYHPQTAGSLNNLALLLRDQGELDTARTLLERALEIRERVLGPHHPHTARSLNNLAGLLWDQGELDTARTLCRRALEISEDVLDADHPQIAVVRANLARLGTPTSSSRTESQ